MTPGPDAYELDVDAWFDLAERTQELLDEADPIYASAAREADTDRPAPLLLASDLHLFSRWVEYREFRHVLKWMTETPIWIGLLGDETEGFTQFFHSRPQFDQLAKPPVQRKVLFKLLEPLRDKILFHCMGTAGHGTERFLGEDLVRQWFVQRKIPSFVGQGILTWRVGSEVYRLLVAHSFPGHSYHNPLHSQARALDKVCPSADVVASGHRHQAAISQVYHHEAAYRAGVHPINKSWLVSVGTAKCLDDPYSLTRWQQGNFEWYVLVFWPDRHRVDWVRHREDLNRQLEERDE